MGQVIGEILPLAVGVAISPLPIIAVILMLLAPRAGAASAGFLAGWLAGILLAAAVVTAVAAAVGLAGSGGGSTASAIVKLALGGLLLLLAVRQWNGRPQPGTEPALPGWLQAIDSITPGRAVILGVGLSAVNPKNLTLILGAGVAIGAADLPFGQVVMVIVIFTVLAGGTVALPVIAYRLAQDRAESWLNVLESWLVAHNAAVMMALFVVLGVVLIGKGIGGL